MYYFKADMSGLYLILKVPYERKTKTKYGKYYASYLRNKSNYIREFLEENGKLEENLVFSVDLAENRVKSKLHDSATIVAKYYDKYTIPSTEDLVLDIKRFSDLRKFILNNYTDQIDISVNEWVSALEDNSVIDNKMFSIFDIMYDMPGCQATTGQLIKIREKLGYMNEKSYNSAIIANSNRVKNFLNKKAVYNKDGTENYWMRFFYGTEVRARNKGKTGKAFQFTLKDELIEALGKANRNDDEVDVLENVYNNDLEEDYIETERVDDMVEEKIFNSFYDYLLYKGYFFDKETIENYLLSLKAKPFAILTGNSGTGKTKLSQLFAQYLNMDNSIDDNIKKEGTKFLSTSVKVGKSAESRGWSIYRDDALDLVPKMECEDYFPVLIDGMPGEGKINFNVRFFYKNNMDIKNHLEELANENPNQRINLELEIPNNEIDNPYPHPITSETNYKIIPVGANWTENRHIVGYYNVITNEYQSTPAYDLIKAANNSTEPYFLILDEMNLSHVERYFADFLSAIESGEKIPLYGEEELTLPSNLFIIGTVNVDETTYMFSPKVLDRANVIEFETYSANDYMNDNINLSSPSGNIEYLENPLAGNEIREYGIDELREIFADVVIDEEPFWDVLSYEINTFQTVLSKSGFDFGFRVINEIVRFMAVAWEYEGKPSEFANWTRYFDACIKQKMLPKLHGSEKIIGETLEELSDLCSDSVIGTEDMVKYPESYKKLEEMKKILRKQRYVSFIN